MAKILVLILSGPEAGFRVASGLGFASVAHDQGAEVRVVFFADGVRVPVEAARHPQLSERIAVLRKRGLLPTVCQRNLETLGASLTLEGFEVRYIGTDLVKATDEGFQIISF